MCNAHVEKFRRTEDPAEFGLYHSPEVSTETFEKGLKLADRSLDVGCVCGNALHRFRNGIDGWERDDIVLAPGERIFIWPTT